MWAKSDEKFVVPKRRFWKKEQKMKADFRLTVRWFVAQIEYSHQRKRSSNEPRQSKMFFLPKSSFRDHTIATPGWVSTLRRRERGYSQVHRRCDAVHMTRCGSSLYKQDQSVYKPKHVVRCDAVHMTPMRFFFVQTRSVGLQTEACGPMRCGACGPMLFFFVQTRSVG